MRQSETFLMGGGLNSVGLVGEFMVPVFCIFISFF